jgi:plasmid stabilization system protein ParE
LIPYHFHSEAEAEFVDAAVFYETRLTGLGASFVAAIERAVALIREHPEAGSPLGSRLRKVVVRRFPYAVFYRRETDRLLILAVAHQGRRPGYWRQRR